MFEKIRKDFASDMSVMNTGRVTGPMSEEQRTIRSVKTKGVPKSEQAKENMKGPKSEHQLRGLRASSAARKGTTRPEEERRKMRKPKREGTSAVYSKITKGKVSAYDIELRKVVRVTTEEFYKMKNIKYVGVNSKLRVKENG